MFRVGMIYPILKRIKNELGGGGGIGFWARPSPS